MTKNLAHWYTQNLDLNGFLVSKIENIYHLTGFWGSFGFFVHQKDGPNYLVTDGRYAETAKSLADKSDFEFILFTSDFSKDIIGNFACEESASLGDLRRLKKYFPAIKFTPQNQVIEGLRRVKNNDEISKIKIAQDHVDTVLIDFLKENLKTGITEQTLNFKLQQALQNDGKYGLSFPSITAFGENSSAPHHVSGDRPLKPGDNILIDCGITHQHYCSDMTRNFIFGSPDPEYLKKYQLLLTAQAATNKKITAGASTQAIDEYCRDQLGPEAEFFTHSLGHGVGLEIHELPTLSMRKDYTLQVGEVVTNEPGLYYPGKFGIRIEDLVVVTNQEPTILSQTSKDLLSFDEAGQVQIIINSGV